MKSLQFLILSLFFTITSIAQDSIHVETNYRDGQLNEMYSRNAAGLKEGNYVRYTRFGKKYISGRYKEGQPVGIWQFYSSDTSGVLVQTLDFNIHKEMYVDPYHVTSLLCGPRYFGGSMLENEYVALRVQNDFTATEKAQLRGQVYVLTFTIDNKTYKPYGITIDDTSVLEPIKSKLIKIVEDMPAWLPPLCKDKAEVWRFSVPIIFN